MTLQEFQQSIREGIPAELPAPKPYDPEVNHAPKRKDILTKEEKKLAIRNALRYFEPRHHAVLAREFAEELEKYGRIYMYRFRPDYEMYAHNIYDYPHKCLQAAAIMLMINNNLDKAVAQHPHELITYGGNGAVFQNWAQYRLAMKYLSEMTDEQTLVMYSGHPLGLFPSHKDAPRVVVTNGMVIPNYSKQDDWERFNALGVSQYGQMTAGSYMYIGPQGIVHGTFNTLLNAGRKKLGIPQDRDLRGYIFVSSGLGGMSGAQPKAAVIAGAASIIAEVDSSRIQTRHSQGWVQHVTEDKAEAFRMAQEAMQVREPISIAYHGNIVDLLEFAEAQAIRIDLLSDQTSCHAVYEGGYCPVGISFAERTELLSHDMDRFCSLVDQSLHRHFEVIKKLVACGTYFFDYGNSFMKAIYDAGVKEISRNGIDEKDGFIWPSYVEDIMGPELFDYGYGPFRWVCLSGKHEDLVKTDQAAMDCIDPNRRGQDRDNYNWIRDAETNRLVVGTEARILYQDAEGRLNIALRFNRMVRDGEVGPIMLGRDHHDVSGTDSPFRETSNIYDGSNVMADMAVQCFAGNAARGMSLVALHNGGGVGIGKAVNGGFGMVLDGSERVDEILRSAMLWDVMGGVARRSWARNPNAMSTSAAFNENYGDWYHITLPFIPKEDLIQNSIRTSLKRKV